MKKVLLILFILGYTVVPLFCSAQDSGQSQQNLLEFKILRQNDNLNIIDPSNFYQNLKFISLDHNNFLSFGGSYRVQAESFINEQFDKDKDQTDTWFLQRAMLHAHLRLGSRFEMFSELNASFINSKQNIAPVDKDELGLSQFFAKYRFNDNFNLLVGRQNVRLGSGRLVDIREGPNVRLSFDMAQLQYKDQKTEITGFYAIPVQQKPGVFDNRSLDANETLSALYWTQNWAKKTNTDFYLFYKNEADKTWNAGTEDDYRVSVGLRHFGNWRGLNYNNEFVYQTGSFGNKTISAWTASFNIEKQFTVSHPFAFGIKTEAISGDTDANDKQLNTFDALYPRGAYFGRVARFGPSNLIDLHPYFVKQLDRLHLELDYVAFWRFSTNDGIYNPALILDYPSLNNKGFIGHQIGTIAGYNINSFIDLELETNIIFPGAFLKENTLNDNLFHLVATVEFKF